MSDQPDWKENYPVSQPREHQVSRRELTKFACLGAAACACAAGLRPVLFKTPEGTEPVSVARNDELAPGQSKLFRYPTEQHPAILVRLSDGTLVAYSQSCTHLMCPIHFDAESEQLVCPCHNGYFDPADGSVLAGPPPRALPSFPVTVRDGTIFVG